MLKSYRSLAEANDPDEDFQAFNQTLDHFNTVPTGTFQQKWLSNDTFYNALSDDAKKEAPVFLQLPGPNFAAFQTNLNRPFFFNKLAQEHGALMVMLEHRFTGDSFPSKNISLSKQLRLLAPEQGIADIATFIAYIRKRYALTEKNKIITMGTYVGGSYAAWARQKLPHLVYAAYASAAPVRAQKEFNLYQSITSFLADESIGGSEQCVKAYGKALGQVKELMASSGSRAFLGQLFNACPESTLDDHDSLGYLLFSIADQIQFTVEGNGILYREILKTSCATMTNNSVPFPVIRLAQVYHKLRGGDLAPCTNFNATARLEDRERYPIATRGKPWTQGNNYYFLQCSRYGWFPSCTSESDCGIFSTLAEFQGQVWPNAKLCRNLYKIGKRGTQQQIGFTNLFYGGARPASSRVLYVNGLADPRSVFSVLHNETNGQIAINIEGVAGAKDWFPPNFGGLKDPPQLVFARKQIAEIVAKWLQE